MSAPLFSKVLVANRGEIAVRVIRACRELGIGAVAVYSEADRDALHVRVADEAHLLGPGVPAESYLHQDRVIEAALRSGAQAIHPGYGFLAENAVFARRVAAEGLTWIGPPPEAMEMMGSKIEARRIMQAAGVPIVPGTTEEVREVERVLELGDRFGWPIALKASAGGGGKGFEVVATPADAAVALERSRRQGEAYFSDPAVYVEKYIASPRHVEIQIIADAHGNVVALGERDCSLQRRHQKVVEEAPSPALDDAIRARMCAMGVDAARAVGYVNAGTIETIFDDDTRDFYFLEMNTRIQVEHCVTELVTGIDLVREQLRVAAGLPLSFRQEDVHVRGHAIECRINAEDAASGFLPSPGRITAYREPAGPGVRVDAALEEGGEIVPLYDPMVAKLLVWDADRDAARARMRRALDEYVVEGVKTLIPLHRLIMESPEFARGETCHGLVEETWPAVLREAEEAGGGASRARVAPAQGARGPAIARAFVAEVDGHRHDVVVHVAEEPWLAETRDRLRERRSAGAGAAGAGAVVSPMQGTLLKLAIAEGDVVEAGQVVAVVEAMKMENEVVAPRSGASPQSRSRPARASRRGQVLAEIAEP